MMTPVLEENQFQRRRGRGESVRPLTAGSHGGTVALYSVGSALPGSIAAVWMRFLVLLVLAISPPACSEQAPGTAPGSNEVRIVSLSPAMTQIIVDCGLRKYLVGRTPYCEQVDPAIPVIGDLKHIDFESLVRIRPTHVLIQPSGQGIGGDLRSMAAERNWMIVDAPLRTIEEIAAFVERIGAVFEGVGGGWEASKPRAAEVRSGSGALAEALRAVLDPDDPPIYEGRVLIATGSDGLLAFGRQTFLHDILEATGARNAVDGSGWVHLSAEDAKRIDPDAILVVRPGRSASASNEQVPHVLSLLDLRAVREDRIATLRHPLALLPSTSLIEVAAELREILRAWGPAAERALRPEESPAGNPRMQESSG